MPCALVVDDEFDIQHIISLALAKIGVTTISAGSAGQCLETLSSNKAPDVILMDFCLPDMNGAKLIDQVRRVHPTIPIILMSASVEFSQSANAFYVAYYLEKPFKLQALQHCVQEALGKAGRSIEPPTALRSD